MLYGFFDEAGRIATAHDDDTVHETPTGAIELTREQFLRRFELIVEAGELRFAGLPDVSFSERCERMWNRIKSERDRRQLEGGVKVGNHWFLSTERATGEYNSLINASQGAPENTVLRAAWRTMDGAEVEMTPALARQILNAGIQQRCLIDDAALAHKWAMEKSSDPASYDFTAGWPAIFAV